MKASELIEKLLELTQEYGQDLEVVYDIDIINDMYYHYSIDTVTIVDGKILIE